MRLFYAHFFTKLRQFQLTHLLRGATHTANRPSRHRFDFNSRTSCEVRHNRVKNSGQLVKFQLTHLLRGATIAHFLTPLQLTISTHAPLARCDVTGTTGCTVYRFQLTHLLRGATHPSYLRLPPRYFNSRTSCEVRLPTDQGFAGSADFNSRTSCEVRRNRPRLWRGQSIFQLTHLLRGATKSAN